MYDLRTNIFDIVCLLLSFYKEFDCSRIYLKKCAQDFLSFLKKVLVVGSKVYRLSPRRTVTVLLSLQALIKPQTSTLTSAKLCIAVQIYPNVN